MAIEKLPSIGTINPADSIPVASSGLGSDARVTFATLLTWVQANISTGVTPIPLTISGTPVLTGVAGAAYAGFAVMAAGGTPPYTYSLNAAAIGAGLTINSSTGVVGGTLGAAATYSASITATDVLGSTVMLPFILVIAAAPVVAPTIVTQPNPQSVTPPATATFSVVATTGGGVLAYQWQKNGGNIAGATSSTYTTPATVSGDNGSSFTCVVSNSAGSVTSSAAVLTVAATVVLPTITVQPTSRTVQAPATTTFNVTATNGGGVLSYQWRRGGAAITGATGASYTTGATATSDSGASFTVDVTNSAGTVTSSAAVLTVTPATLTISGTPATTAQVGVAYNFTPTTSGGAGGNVFSIAAGALPAGLSINAGTGAIAGSPTASGTFAGIVERVTDSASSTASLAAFTLTVAAAALDTRPRFVAAAANAYTTPATLLASMTAMTGSSNGGRAGSFSLTTTAGNYGWVAVVASGAPSGVVFTDTSGFPGGWSGAGLAGANTGASPNPSTVNVAYTDSNGTAWKFFRQDYPNVNPTAMAWTAA